MDRLAADGSAFASSPSAPFLGYRAHRWRNGVWEDLGDIDPSRPSTFMLAYAISADGTVIAGSDAEFSEPFIWIEGRGMMHLQAYLLGDFGMDLGGYELEFVFDMTPDGRTFVGTARDPSGQQVGYLITVPGPGSVAVLLGLGGVLGARRRRRDARTD